MSAPAHTDADLEMFLYYGGDKGKPKFTKEQILKDAITFGHCKVCDKKVEGGDAEHLRQLRKDLTAYLGKRRAAAERAKAAGLRKGRGARAEKAAHDEAAQIVADALTGGGDDDE